jgi:hypothetical protein
MSSKCLIWSCLTPWKKHVTGLQTLDEKQPVVAFLPKVDHDFKQTAIEINIWGAFQPYGLLMTLSRIRMDYSSIRKSSDKVRALWSYGNASRHSTVCRSAGKKKQSLYGSTNQNKSISSVFHIVLMLRNEDMPPII